MRERSGHFTGEKALEIHWRAWLPARTEAVVIVVHDWAGHGGHYAALAQELAAHRCASYAIDHRGHGRSQGPRALIDSVDAAVNDLHQLVDQVRQAHPRKPLFLLGHGFGGALSISYALKQRGKIHGLVLVAPTLQLDGLPYRTAVLAPLLSRLKPNAPLHVLDDEARSRDPQALPSYRSDPFNHHGKLPARTLAVLIKLLSWLPALYPAVEIPLLLMHGTEDRLAPVAGSKRLHQQSASHDKTLHCYPGLHHDLLHEPASDRQRVIGDLLAWIAART